MSIGDDEFGLPPRCKTCGDTTPADGVCVECKPYAEYVCLRCLRGKPKPVDQEPPAMPPIDPEAFNADEPPPSLAYLGDYRSTTQSDGCTIDEHENGWAVRRNYADSSVAERRFYKSRGHTRKDALNYAAEQHAKHHGGG